MSSLQGFAASTELSVSMLFKRCQFDISAERGFVSTLQCKADLLRVSFY
jgi:hypothetical protein